TNNTVTTIEKPIIQLETVKVNYNEIDISNSKKIQLNPTENNISFTYKTVSLANTDSIEYRYKLNNNYSPWTKSSAVDFANLKAGNYQFYAQSKIGNQLSKEVCFSFAIDNPYYKKDWFYILLATSFFGLLFLIMEFRFQKTKKENQQKIKALKLQNHLISLEQKALQLQMNPHFIFNVLNGIKAFGNKGEILAMNETISQFAILLRSVLNNSRAEEINLKEATKVLENYLALEQKMSTKNFVYSIKHELQNIDVEEILVPPMLVQPFIENSIKHGFQPNTKDNTIKILFEVKHRFLHCTIIDNGIGLQQSKQQKSKKYHQSVALQITKERIINLSSKHSFSIEEIKNKTTICGTKVWFKIPLKTDY
ncbi:histidine kinase, partial [Polaribacter sp.]|nr:histidine kinase [Polaribacter sp.]